MTLASINYLKVFERIKFQFGNFLSKQLINSNCKLYPEVYHYFPEVFKI